MLTRDHKVADNSFVQRLKKLMNTKYNGIKPASFVDDLDDKTKGVL